MDLKNRSNKIELLSPNGGEKIHGNSIQVIKCQSSGDIQNVKIDLLEFGKVKLNITESAENTGSFEWDIPEDVSASDGYIIRVCDVNYDAIFDEMDDPFSIYWYYTVTYNGNDQTSGSAPVDNNTYIEGDVVNILENTGNLTKTDKIFGCWNTENDASGTLYSPTATFTMGDSDIILYADWDDGDELITISGGTFYQTDGTDGFNHTISTFEIGKYEVSYNLWYTVRQWAASNGYTFANFGREGNDGTIGNAPTPDINQPVMTVTWRDCIVWCNAYSEMFGLTPCYTDSGSVIKNSNLSICDNAVCDWNANGYRLPTEGEWQFVASEGGVVQWNHVSGDTTGYCYPLDEGASSEYWKYAWFEYNSSGYSKDIGTKLPNAFGTFDMSGNAFEWTWDWNSILPSDNQENYKGPTNGSDRTKMGSCYYFAQSLLHIGNRTANTPSQVMLQVGLRVARNPNGS